LATGPHGGDQLIHSNAEGFTQAALDLVDRGESIEVVVIDAEAITDVGSTGAEALLDTVQRLRERGLEVHLARVHKTVYDALERGGMVGQIGPESFSEDLEGALPPASRSH
jgi:anti-anti-sigma regulatory factor